MLPCGDASFYAGAMKPETESCAAAVLCRRNRAALSGLIVFTSGKTFVVVLAEVHYVVLFAYNPYSVARI